MTFNLGFIGGGNMSTAIAKGILKTALQDLKDDECGLRMEGSLVKCLLYADDLVLLALSANELQLMVSRARVHEYAHLPSKVWVSGPHLDHLKHWSELGTNVTTKNGEVFCNCDVIFLGVKPSMLQMAVDDCLKTITKPVSCKKVLFISMLAGITIGDLQKALKQLSKDVSVIRIMPNTPMTIGEGACLYSPDETVTESECALVEKMLNSCGMCERVPESLIDSLGSLIGCGPAFMYIVIEALADGAVKQGVPRDLALRFAAQMVAGSGKMVLQSGKHPGLLKDEVCSPGGSTIAGVTALEQGKIRATLINAIEASTLRTKELRKK